MVVTSAAKSNRRIQAAFAAGALIGVGISCFSFWLARKAFQPVSVQCQADEVTPALRK